MPSFGSGLVQFGTETHILHCTVQFENICLVRSMMARMVVMTLWHGTIDYNETWDDDASSFFFLLPPISRDVLMTLSCSGSLTRRNSPFLGRDLRRLLNIIARKYEWRGRLPNDRSRHSSLIVSSEDPAIDFALGIVWFRLGSAASSLRRFTLNTGNGERKEIVGTIIHGRRAGLIEVLVRRQWISLSTAMWMCVNDVFSLQHQIAVEMTRRKRKETRRKIEEEEEEEEKLFPYSPWHIYFVSGFKTSRVMFSHW